jgi:hypothetical protein
MGNKFGKNKKVVQPDKIVILPQSQELNDIITLNIRDFKMFTVRVNNGATVLDIKKAIHARKRYELSDQKLYYRGVPLKDDIGIGQYLVDENKTIKLVVDRSSRESREFTR